MKIIKNINKSWKFEDQNKVTHDIDLPHTWNGIDGQDGGADYYRGTLKYTTTFDLNEDINTHDIYLEFKAVNASAIVYLNDELVGKHDGGYSAFRFDITKFVKPHNELVVLVDNSENDKVYPQKADFTFYGGIYRDVNLLILDKDHFDYDYFGALPIKIDPVVLNNEGKVVVEAFTKSNKDIIVEIYDGDNNLIKTAKNKEEIIINNPHLWNGKKDPYLYVAKAKLMDNDKVIDEVSHQFGFRTFTYDSKKGFFLNGISYPLRGVSRHQDRLLKGNAISKEDQEEDMNLILDIGANTIRLAHYQHDDYFLDLCDKYGLVIWAEVPYISKHMPNAKENIEQQLKELIYQQYNHPSIAVWGISNEITMFKADKKDLIADHVYLNNLVHKIDPNRKTVLACFAMCGPMNKIAHITDVVSWNLYLGWYVHGLFLNDLWLHLFHLLYPKRCIGYSEYGAEGMPNLHSSHPKIGDNSEEYQAHYHEFLLRCFARHPYLWATHVWNMFDFASDGRDQGGEPGRNHKGLVTIDRKIKKDSFYLYKAYWSDEPFVHIASKRYVNRIDKKATITVYSNQKHLTFIHNGKVIEKDGDKVFTFKIKLAKENKIEVKSGNLYDVAYIKKVDKPDPSYVNKTGNSHSWEKKDKK